MATKFLEPGSDATWNVASTTGGGFWTSVTGTPVSVSDYVHSSHVRSIQFVANAANAVLTANIQDTGTRVSMYVYLVAYPSSTTTLWDSNSAEWTLSMTTAGVLSFKGATSSALSLNKWYRISMAYTATDSTHNEFRIFVDNALVISITNATLSATGATNLRLGNPGGNSTFDWRASDIYIDDSSALTDPGNIFVIAKRPFSNGLVNGFDTQIGSANSGYGSGHADEVNERALSTTNGWSKIGAGAAVTEEYTLETPGIGDFIMNGRIVDYVGWVYAKSGTSETGQIVVNGTSSNISLTSTNTMFTKVAGSTVYPITGAAIGIVTDTTLTTVSLYECGIMIAFIPAHDSSINTVNLRASGFNPGLAR